MNKASSLFVLILLGSLVSDAVAQSHPPRGPGQGQGQHGQPGQHGPGPAQPIPQYPQPIPQPMPQPAPQPIPQPIPQPMPQHPSQGQVRVISQELRQSLRSYETLRLSEVLRLSMNESRDLEVLSITVVAQSLKNQASVDVLSRGRSIVVPQIVRRQLAQVRLQLPISKLDDLEITASDEIILDSIQIEVRNSQPQIIKPFAGQMIRVELSQSIRNGEVPLKQLVKQQLGLSLEGVTIERVVVTAQSLRGAASVQIEMNNRPVSVVKAVPVVSRNILVPVMTPESVNGNLRVVVRGEVHISSISIKVGQVSAW